MDKRKATEAAPLNQDKGNIYFSNPQRQRIYEMLLSGEKLTVVQLTNELRIPDPRSHIRYIRNKGVYVADYWQETEYSRYKVYFIHQEERRVQ